MIAGIGSWAAKAHEYGVCRNSTGAHTVYNDFAIIQQASSLAVNFLGTNGGSTACVTPNTVTLSGLPPYHFIVAVNASTVVTYFQGASVPNVRPYITMGNWLSNMNLMLGQTLSPSPSTSTAYTTTTWTGDVFLAAIYGRTLSTAEIQQNHAAGMPRSVPMPYPSSLWIAVYVHATFVAVPLLTCNNTDNATYAPITMYVATVPVLGTLSPLDEYGQPTDVKIGGDVPHRTPFAFTSSLFGYKPVGDTGYVERFQYYVSYTHTTQTQQISGLFTCSQNGVVFAVCDRQTTHILPVQMALSSFL